MSAADLENTLYLDVPKGRVVIELRPDLAPKTVARIKELARKGFYDGHRVPSRDRRLHGADRRSARRRHRRLGPEAQGRVQQRAFRARHRVGMARAARSRQRRQPVLHLLRAGAVPRRQIHRLRPGHVGHGDSSTRSRRATRATTARSRTPTASSRCRSPPTPTRRSSAPPHLTTEARRARSTDLRRALNHSPDLRAFVVRLDARHAGFASLAVYRDRRIAGDPADGVRERPAAGAHRIDAAIWLKEVGRLAHGDRPLRRRRALLHAQIPVGAGDGPGGAAAPDARARAAARLGARDPGGCWRWRSWRWAPAIRRARPARSRSRAVVVAFLSASQDIVIDAYRVELLADREQGAGAAATQIGYRIGMVASTAGALYLASFFGWFCGLCRRWRRCSRSAWRRCC